MADSKVPEESENVFKKSTYTVVPMTKPKKKRLTLSWPCYLKVIILYM